MPTFSFPIGSVLRAVTVCQAPGQISTNTHKWQLTALTGASTFNSGDFLSDYDSNAAALYLPLLALEASYYGTMLYLENPIGPAPRPDNSNLNSGPGTGGTGLLPTQTSGLISLYTDTLGKTGQGRSYIPFPSADALSVDGTPTVGYGTDLQNLASFLTTDRVLVIGGVNATFAPVMYPGGAAPIKFITGSKAADAWATQRRRGSYGRTNNPPF